MLAIFDHGVYWSYRFAIEQNVIDFLDRMNPCVFTDGKSENYISSIVEENENNEKDVDKCTKKVPAENLCLTQFSQDFES